MKPIGELMQAWMHLKGIKNKDLAVALGLSEQQTGLLLKCNANKWKLSYFDEACKYMKLNPKTFFDDWNDGGNSIVGTIENNAILGNSSFAMVSGNNDYKDVLILKDKLKEKETQISSLNEVISLQRVLLKQAGVELPDSSKDSQ